MTTLKTRILFKIISVSSMHMIHLKYNVQVYGFEPINFFIICFMYKKDLIRYIILLC